jgi:hypothetical protein
MIRIMAGSKMRVCCRKLFRPVNILPLARKFILLVLSFVVENLEVF